MIHRIFCFLLLLVNLMPASGQKERGDIRKGNKAYKGDDFASAEINYRKALDINNESSKATFNLGDALYRQERYKEAAESFSALSEREEAEEIVSETHYNMGNSMALDGKFDEAIEAYKRSLRANPGNHQAKYNLAWAMDQKKKEEEKKDQNKDDQEKEDQQEDNNSDKKQDPGQDKDKRSDNQQQQMKKEEAERLLQALAANDEKVREKVNQDKVAAAKVRTKINW